MPTTGREPTADGEPQHRNEVLLVGRLAAAAEPRVLPSGDLLVAFRLVVARTGRSRPRSPTVDTVDCTGWRAPVRREAGRWSPGDVVEVTGALRRRFWRTATGPVSRYEVEVRTARRL
jgi:single-strand DNA-binding protein